MPVRDRAYLPRFDHGPQVVQGETYVYILLVGATVEIGAGVGHRQVLVVDVAGNDSVVPHVTREWTVIGPVYSGRRYDGNPGVYQLRSFDPWSLLERRRVSSGQALLEPLSLG